MNLLLAFNEARRIGARSRTRTMLLMIAGGVFWFLICQLILLRSASSELMSGVFRQVPADLYLFRNSSDADIQSLKALVDSMSELEWAQLITPEHAAQKFAESYGEDALQVLGENPFPLSVELRLPLGGNRRLMEEQLLVLEGESAVEELKLSRGLLDRVAQRLQSAARWLVYAILGLLILVLLLQRLAWRAQLESYRSEMETMALLGASPGMLRLPLLVLAVLEGLLPALLVLALFSLEHQALAMVGIRVQMPYSLVWILLPAGLWMPMLEFRSLQRRVEAAFWAG